MSRAAEAWEVEGGGEVKERERERERWREEREGGRAREGRERVLCGVELQGSDAGAAAAAAGALVAAAAARGMRAEKKVRRVRAERALSPSRRLPLACLLAVYCVCTCVRVVIDIDYMYTFIVRHIVGGDNTCYQSGNSSGIIHFIKSFIRSHQRPSSHPETDTMPSRHRIVPKTPAPNAIVINH